MYKKLALGVQGCLAVAVGVALAQVPAARPAGFEVAAIRPAAPFSELIQKVRSGQTKLGMSVEGSRVEIVFISLEDLIRRAYGLKTYQLEGPGWMSQQRFDIQARMPDGASKDAVPEMLQTLLAERFGMVAHKVAREKAVYALIAGKNGPKLTAAVSSGGGAAAADPTQFNFKRNGPNGTSMQVGNTIVTSSGGTDPTHMEVNGMTMPALADALSNFVDRPVVDMTGLAGEYRVVLDLSREDLSRSAQRVQQMAAELGLPLPALPGNADEASAPAGGSVFTAVEKLGLKLDSRKAPVDVLVIEHLERTPTEN